MADVRTQIARSAHWIALALFALLVTREYASPTPVRAPSAQPEAHGDGNYYYAYLRSLAFDRDVWLENDFQLLDDQFNAGLNPITKHAQNVFTIGPALFWLPFVPLAYALEARERAKLPPNVPPPPPINGTESVFQRTALFGSAFAGLVTTALGLWLVLRFTSPVFATLASIGLCIGSPLIWYMLRQASFSHAVDSCAVALFVTAWVVGAGARSWRGWLGVGALLGLAMMVRPQNVLHALLPLGEWLYAVWLCARAHDRRGIARQVLVGVGFVLATALAFSPLLLVWRAIYGAWILVPQGSTFMDWSNSRWDAALFTPRGGLFAWHPLTLVSVFGLLALALMPRFPRRLRLLGALSLVVLVLQAYVNGCAKDWWAGWAFGGRRFLSCTIYFMIGLGVVLELGRRVVERHPLRTAQVLAASGLLVCALYNRSLSHDYVNGQARVDGVQRMKPRMDAAFTSTLEELYRVTGNPGSLPASALFSIRAQISPDRYDIAAGNDFLDHDLERGRDIWFDDFHAMGGFDPESRDWKGRRPRRVRGGRAIWVFALRKRMALEGTVTMASAAPGAHVTFKLHGKPFFEADVGEEWHDHPFTIPEQLLDTGVNYVEVEQRGGRRATVGYDRAFLRGILPARPPARP